MKNHTGEGQAYNMSSLKEAIQPQEVKKSQDQNISLGGNFSCRKCGKLCKELNDLKKHLISEHKTYRPCKNFSSNPSEDKCSWKEKCGYSHTVLEPGTCRCWDCGKIFNNKNELMIHRKINHDLPFCNKYNSGNGCNKPDNDCWYPHKTKHEVRTNSQLCENINKPASYAKVTSSEQDFPKVTQFKTTPTETEPNSQTRTEQIMIETMNMMKEQNKTMMELILGLMQQNQQIIGTAPRVPPSQS